MAFGFKSDLMDNFEKNSALGFKGLIKKKVLELKGLIGDLF